MNKFNQISETVFKPATKKDLKERRPGKLLAFEEDLKNVSGAKNGKEFLKAIRDPFSGSGLTDDDALETIVKAAEQDPELFRKLCVLTAKMLAKQELESQEYWGG